MAIFTSHNGNFEVEAISFSPEVIAMNEETEYSISIRNVSGKNISRLIMDMRLRFKDRDGAARFSDEVLVFGDYPLETSPGYWNAGKTVTFIGKFKLTSFYGMENSSRVLPIYKGSEMGYDSDEDVGLMLNFTTNVIFDNMTNSDSFYNLRGADSEYLTVLDARYKPAIPVFAAERATDGIPDDEGESLLSAIRLSASAAALPERMELKLTGGGAAEDLSALVNSALAGEISAILPGSYGRNGDWPLTLTFGDEYESASITLTVPKAFANVHLSGASTGGVCFGSFSRATEGNPLFQCYYPAAFYAGIDGVTNYASAETPTGGSWIDGKPIHRRVLSGSIAANGTSVIGTIANMETVVSLRGMVKWTDTEAWCPLVFSTGGTTHNSCFVSARGEVSVYSAQPAAACAIIEYTKTTEEMSE